MSESLSKKCLAFTQNILSFTVFAEKSQERLGNFYVSSENIRKGKPELVLNFPHMNCTSRSIPVPGWPRVVAALWHSRREI